MPQTKPWHTTDLSNFRKSSEISSTKVIIVLNLKTLGYSDERHSISQYSKFSAIVQYSECDGKQTSLLSFIRGGGQHLHIETCPGLIAKTTKAVGNYKQLLAWGLCFGITGCNHRERINCCKFQIVVQLCSGFKMHFFKHRAQISILSMSLENVLQFGAHSVWLSSYIYNSENIW